MKLSLLGALFFENAVVKLKKFLQKEASEVKNHVPDLTEAAQLLACESVEEVEAFLDSQASPRLRGNKRLVSGLVQCRVDFDSI